MKDYLVWLLVKGVVIFIEISGYVKGFYYSITGKKPKFTEEEIREYNEHKDEVEDFLSKYY